MLTFYNDMDDFFFLIQDHFSLLEQVLCLNVSSVRAIIYSLGHYITGDLWPVLCQAQGTLRLTLFLFSQSSWMT